MHIYAHINFLMQYRICLHTALPYQVHSLIRPQQMHISFMCQRYINFLNSSNVPLKAITFVQELVQSSAGITFMLPSHYHHFQSPT